MIWEWKTSFNFDDYDGDNAPNNQVRDVFSEISTTEIQNLKSRVNFYLAHFMILAKKDCAKSSEIKINYLKRLNDILDNEISARQKRIYL